MEGLSSWVETRITERLHGRRIGFLFDAWSVAGYHFVAVLAVTPSLSAAAMPSAREKFLLSLQPIDPKHFNASKKLFDVDAIIELFDEALGKYGIDVGQLCSLVGDNASVNGSVARKSKLPFIGCASHRLNLAVEQDLALYCDEVEKVEALMRYLRTSKQRTILRTVACPQPVVNNVTRWSSTFEMLKRFNVTRWSSTFEMLKRFKKMMPHLDGLNVEPAPLLPTPQEMVNIEALYDDLKKFQSVNMKLQRSEGITLRDARVLFDRLLETFEAEGTCTTHLATGARVVAFPDFEKGLVKLQGGREHDSCLRARSEELNVFCIPLKTTGPVRPAPCNSVSLTRLSRKSALQQRLRM